VSSELTIATDPDDGDYYIQVGGKAGASGALSLAVSGPPDDRDADGLSLDDELALGTNPDNIDSDGDFMPDAYEAADPGCLFPVVHDRAEDPDADASPNGWEHFWDTLPCDSDTDDDGFLDRWQDLHISVNLDPSRDNCPTVANPQLNFDAAPVPNGPRLAGDDASLVMSDFNGDACDWDDDNDGLADFAETPGVQPCLSASTYTNPQDMDTDGDHLADGWECDNGSDPASAGSKFLGSGTADEDGDLIQDLWERRGYGGAGSSPDEDGDGCADLVEIASVDGNKTLTDVDRIAVARRAAEIWGPDPAQDYVLDVNKNGSVNDVDRIFVARAVALDAWLPKSCP
jgi:hypothetical protein